MFTAPAQSLHTNRIQKSKFKQAVAFLRPLVLSLYGKIADNEMNARLTEKGDPQFTYRK